MFNLPGLHVKVESVRSVAVQGLIGEDTDDDLYGPNASFLVARVDGSPVGCIALVDQVRFGEARRLFVKESARGSGIGAALVTALEAAARDIGLRHLRLDTRGSSARARETFASAGYIVKASDDTRMEKQL